MAAILAQVQGDAIRPGLLGDEGRLNRLGVARTPRLANSGNVIDVHPEEDLPDGFR
jgi:hypothetical protein